MIIYKTSDSKWRIPRSIMDRGTSSFNFADSIRTKNSSGGWDIKWHRNQSTLNPVGSSHPFWQYSMNPDFNVSEGNYFTGHGGELEISYNTNASDPGEQGRYISSGGNCNIYITSVSATNAGSTRLRSKFPLNVINGGRYRNRVEIVSRTPSDENYGVMPCRYYRFIVDGVRDSGAANAVQLSELRLFDVNGNNLDAIYTGAGQNMNNLKDNNLSTKWVDFNEIGSTVTMIFPSNTKIGGYRLATANDLPERDPTSWRLQASTNGSTWVTISNTSGYIPTSSRSTWYQDDFILRNTIALGFFSNTAYDTADKGQSGTVDRLSPRIDIGRTTSTSGSNMPWGDGTSYSYNYFKSTNVYQFDTEFPFNHIWARPYIQIRAQDVSVSESFYTITKWDIIRLS